MTQAIATQYAVLQPVEPEVLESEEMVEMLKSVARLHMAGVGYVVEETFEMKVLERAKIDGHVLPWEWDGYRLPDSTVLVRFTAFINPFATEENN
ncbi:hypothetical protein SEA_YECEY3_44 [Mycobacterium phage Yecey3]|uniref:Uncharacterized protein n=1 Tax=Mycobacterium phage Yecey3 TaxID=2656617 RepID=A0A649V900_9CAUD|nr:hypothetical protein KIV58_gp065 [Mycobacterium phage Yecey3]QGJ88796.1 hypothetical protein SEA_YECEY3_44 [Mycobacterium phage Yecey3]